MLHFILAQAASGGDGGKALAGLIVIGCGIWFVAYLCRPKNKGWNINHHGSTTIKPRK